ncbi:hypothetical protein FKM82_030827 [Ascaphus truei]
MQIKDLRGTESTQDACAKMRKSTEQMKKIPRITLSISYRGVKFIDASNQNQAYEIILTLGQAFEVAYQLALQAQKSRPPEAVVTLPSKPIPKPRGSIRRQATESLEGEQRTPSHGGVSWIVDPKQESNRSLSTN